MAGIAVNPDILHWAHRRSGRSDSEIRSKLPKWDRWLTQETPITFGDVQRIAKYTRISLGYFFLAEPPADKLPIPDFRAGRGQSRAISADLLDTLHQNQRRQAWFEEYLVTSGEVEELDFVGSARRMSVVDAAAAMTTQLDYPVNQRADLATDSEARKHLASAFEELGGLVVLSSMVGNNTSRMLSLDEFRGFALQSSTAPLVFVNSNDTYRGQIFSLLHEFAHIWRGDEGISDSVEPGKTQLNADEKWCDAVAAEIAVPAADLHEHYDAGADLTAELDRLSRRYYCSTLVVLIKLRDSGLLPTAGFDDLYAAEKRRLMQLMAAKPKAGGGGNFYSNQSFRVGKTLSRAIVRDTQRGTTSMTEALRLLSFKNTTMFDRYSDHLSGM